MKVWHFAVWILVLVGGVMAFANYSFTPGQAAVASSVWPKNSKLSAAKTKPDLLVFVHPKCSCSYATLRDLEKLLPAIGTRARIRVVFNDLGKSEFLEESSTFDFAKSLPGVEVIKDQNGIESERFGVKTSGQVFLYDESAHLVFSGGMTPSRGHEGESQGAIAVMSWLNTRTLKWQTADVFGCGMRAKL